MMKDLSAHKMLQGIVAKVGLDQLEPRERIALAVGAFLVIGVFVFQLIILPYVDARSRLQKSIARKHVELQEIIRMQQEYAGLRLEEGGIRASLAKRSIGFTLFTFLDQQAEKALVKEQIKYMKPSVIDNDGPLDESVVEIKLQEITLERLVHFMRLVESDENVVSIKRLSVQTSTKEQGYLDVILQIVTFVENG